MDIIDRLGNLLRTILDDDEAGSRARAADPDEMAAWDELEAYMRGDRHDTAAAGEARDRQVPAVLRRDFRNLEVPVGAPLVEVQKAYKRMMAVFHPDRHSSDAERTRTATEIAKKLNQSFQRIRTYYEGRDEAHDTSP